MSSNWEGIGRPHILRPNQVAPTVYYIKEGQVKYVDADYLVAGEDRSLWIHCDAPAYSEEAAGELNSLLNLCRIIRTNKDLVLETVEGDFKIDGESGSRVLVEPDLDRSRELYIPITRLIETGDQLVKFEQELYEACGIFLGRSALFASQDDA